MDGNKVGISNPPNEIISGNNSELDKDKESRMTNGLKQGVDWLIRKQYELTIETEIYENPPESPNSSTIVHERD